MVHQNQFLAGLPPAVLQRIEMRFEVVPLVRGHALLDVGEPARYAYFLTAGLVSLLALTPDGATLELASVGNNGVVGLPIILRSSCAAYQAIVQITGAALRVRADILTTALQESATLRDACLRYADEALADVARSTVCHHFHPLTERLCRWLLTASDRVHQETLELTHDMIAQVLGAPRTAVSMAAMELQKADAIRCQRGRIVIVNRRRLEVTACSCYTAVRDIFTLTPPPVRPR